MNLGNLLNKLDSKLGFLMFKNNNIFSYNLFHYFYEKNITNINSNLYQSFLIKGFYKGPSINLDIINLIKKEMSLQSPKTDAQRFILFKWTDNLISYLNRILKNDLDQTIIDLQKYYNSKIILTHARIQRNFGFKKIQSEEEFSENYHNDRWLSTYFKIFINLEDINISKGPTFLIPRDQKKNFLNETKYKNRLNYKNIDFENAYINVGKIGETLIFSPSICIHKAGIPEINQKRDVLMLQFSVTPFEENEKFNLDKFNFEITKDLLGESDKLSYHYAKPYGFIKTFKLYRKFKKNLIKN